MSCAELHAPMTTVFFPSFPFCALLKSEEWRRSSSNPSIPGKVGICFCPEWPEAKIAQTTGSFTGCPSADIIRRINNHNIRFRWRHIRSCFVQSLCKIIGGGQGYYTSSDNNSGFWGSGC
ncbi:hypothetical protein I7I53_00215 [Histoplasma capsulatum var. duboisii H88]|uniref:Uncharacterized protein n=1 Tax=Ajellomyces capsulatus (strain H88) TaxID=544711 RepID=A0A8A1LM48_AJEC8|nr:hypothetical protein I7I53_00215 [Histoplasma capsulatum var. duboisii H88]